MATKTIDEMANKVVTLIDTDYVNVWENDKLKEINWTATQSFTPQQVRIIISIYERTFKL